MYGAIIGDLAGSIYEYDQCQKEIKEINPKEIISNNAFYSDDTILTMAVLDAYLNDKDFYNYIKKYIRLFKDYKPNFEPYFDKPFSPNLIKWSKAKTIGKSTGNGAMMRISSVGYLALNEDEVRKYAYLATKPSHNTPEAVNAATIVALIIYYGKHGMPREEIFKKLHLKAEYIPFDKFNYTCNETIGNCLYAFYHATSFEDAIIRAVSMGGDTDTNACIVGSMAESIFEIPDYLKNKADELIPDEFRLLLKNGYNNIK